MTSSDIFNDIEEAYMVLTRGARRRVDCLRQNGIPQDILDDLVRDAAKAAYRQYRTRRVTERHIVRIMDYHSEMLMHWKVEV